MKTIQVNENIELDSYDPTNGAPYGFYVWIIKIQINKKWFKAEFSTEEEAKKWKDEFNNSGQGKE